MLEDTGVPKNITVKQNSHLKQLFLAVNSRLMNMRRSQTKLEVKKYSWQIKFNMNVNLTKFRVILHHY